MTTNKMRLYKYTVAALIAVGAIVLMFSDTSFAAYDPSVLLQRPAGAVDERKQSVSGRIPHAQINLEEVYFGLKTRTAYPEWHEKHRRAQRNVLRHIVNPNFEARGFNRGRSIPRQDCAILLYEGARPGSKDGVTFCPAL